MGVELAAEKKKRGYDGEGRGGSSYLGGPGETRVFKTVWTVIACMVLPTLVFVSGAYRPLLPLIAGAYQGSSQHQPLQPPPPQPQPPAVDAETADAVFHGASDVPRDKYLGGLLADGFDGDTCRSRYQSTMYRKPSRHRPSPYLVQTLRKYEDRHRRCAPHTAPYNKALSFLNPGPAPEKETECKYVLWTPSYGLGNRILSLTSAFLYALLTDRVVLIDRGKDMTSLFCEPFPDTTWLLPPDFPIADFAPYRRPHPLRYGNLLRNKNISTESDAPPPSFVYLHMDHDYDTEDMHLFCEPDQAVLKKVPWLFFRSNMYVVPSFFLNRDFEPELSRMFPEKETVFHHLGRYLFHPTDEVWGMVTRYYKSYMATARERLGIQIRVFNSKDAPFDVVAQQVINCTLREGLLPKLDAHASAGAGFDPPAADPAKTKSVLLTSLYTGYLDKIRNMYWEHPAVGGEVLSVHQPTHEERQQTDKESHDLKAWVEMNLLSLTDVLVTSARSTFGYTGHGLGGITPWILLRPTKGEMPEPTCVRDISMEPCFLTPPWYVCREKRNGDNGKVLPFVTHCMDERHGLKLVDRGRA